MIKTIRRRRILYDQKMEHEGYQFEGAEGSHQAYLETLNPPFKLEEHNTGQGAWARSLSATVSKRKEIGSYRCRGMVRLAMDNALRKP